MSTGFAPTAAPSGWNLGDLTPSITQEVQNFLRSQGAAPGTGMSPGAAGQRGFLDILPQLTQLIPVITNAIQTVSRSQPPVMNPAPGQRGFFDDLTKFVGPILQTAQMLSRSQPPGTGTRDFFGDLVHFLPTAVQIVGTVAAVL